MKRVDLVYILAGGQSTRFGKNKALVSILGEPLIVRLASQLASQDLRVMLVAQRTSDYREFALPVIEDGELNCGPLQGMLAALRDCKLRGESWCFVSSCDILDWHPVWKSILVHATEKDPELDAVILSGSNDVPGTFRPLPGLYRSSLWRDVEEIRNAGSSSLREFHKRIDSRIGSCPVEPDLLPKCFNTPSELENLLKITSK